MKGFKAYDIRGVYNKDFTKEDVYRLGFFLPELFDTDKILVGRDMRQSSDEIFTYFTKGIIDSGTDVYDIGLATTPMLYFAAGKHHFNASVQITASHNPKEYNGFKVSGNNVMPIGYQSGLNKLEELVHNEKIEVVEEKGQVISLNVKPDYVKFLKKYVNSDINNLEIGIDCSNGITGFMIKDILNDKPYYIFDDPDGSFPNHEPNPLEPENQEHIKDLVKSKKLDVGVIYDGDGDRVMFIDENGEFVPPDLIIALLGDYFLDKPNEKVLQDIRSSKSIKEYLSRYGAEVHTWRVGRAFAVPKLKEIGGIYGGELAGHYYFKDFYYSDSGILASLIVLDIVASAKKTGKTFSQLISEISNYENSGEINFKIEQKNEAMEELKEHFSNKETPIEVMDFDGYRLEFNDWWFNVRPSNTEPYLRLIVEAVDESTLNEKVDEIKSVITKYN